MFSRTIAAALVLGMASVAPRPAQADVYGLTGLIATDTPDANYPGYSLESSAVAGGSFSGTFTGGFDGFGFTFTGADIAVYTAGGDLYITLTFGWVEEHDYLDQGYDIIGFAGGTNGYNATLDLTFATPFAGTGTTTNGGDVTSDIFFTPQDPNTFSFPANRVDIATATFLAVPEPSAYALLILGGALGVAARRGPRSRPREAAGRA